MKESLFNLLRGWFEDASVLDLFAGVGTMGLEAVSRGARRVVMVERDRKVYQLLKNNIQMLGCEDRAIAIHADALSPAALTSAMKPVDLVFLDPPYRYMEDDKLRQKVIEQAERCRALMGEKGFLVLRSPVGPHEVDLRLKGFEGPEAHSYATDMHVLLYAPLRAAM